MTSSNVVKMEHSSTKVTEKVNSNSFHRKHGMRIGKKFAGHFRVNKNRKSNSHTSTSSSITDDEITNFDQTHNMVEDGSHSDRDPCPPPLPPPPPHTSLLIAQHKIDDMALEEIPEANPINLSPPKISPK